MKFAIFTLCLVFSKHFEGLLRDQNAELENINAELHKRLFSLARSLETQIQEDYFYNKHKIKSLVFEYEKEEGELVKIFLAEEMLKYLQGIVEDSYLMGGQVEGVSSKELISTLHDLVKSVKDSKEFVLAKENANFYNQLHSVLMQKHELVQQIQVENAKIYGKIGKKQAEILEIQKEIEKNEGKVKQMQEEIVRVKDIHTSRTQEIEKSFSTQPGFKLTELQREDSKILALQISNNENSLIIEKHLTEISVLTSNLRVLTDKNQKLEQELHQKSEVFLAKNEKLSNFAGSVRSETTFQALFIEKSLQQLQSERKDLENTSKELYIKVNKCKAEVETGKFVLKTKEMMTEQNKNELSETEDRKRVAIEQRDKEIQGYSVQHLEMINKVAVYQKELDEAMQKVSEKATEIQDLRMMMKII